MNFRFGLRRTLINKIVCSLTIILITSGILVMLSIHEDLNYDTQSYAQSSQNCHHPQKPTNDSKLLNLENFKFIVTPKNPCCTQNTTKLLLVFIHSARRHFTSRQLIRHSYGSLKSWENWTIFYYFLLGEGNPCEHPSIAERLDRETSKYGDIILGTFIDSYRNLSYKHLMGYKWAAENCDGHYNFYLKIDDDILLHLFHLIPLMESISNSDGDIYCSVNHDLPIHRNNASVWASTEEEIEGDTFPPFCAQGVYLLRLPTVARILQASLSAKFFWIDDAFVTGILREAVNRNLDKGSKAINLIRTPTLHYEDPGSEWANTTREWISLVLPRTPPPYHICQVWHWVLATHNLTQFYGSSCDSVI